MQIKTTVILTVRDSATARILKRKRFLSRSYVYAFLQGLYVHVNQIPFDIRDTGNTLRAVAPFVFYNDAFTEVADDNYGIVVGTGTDAVALTDYKLQTQIAHGGGGGQLNYGISQRIGPFTPAGRYAFNTLRDFVNVSGGAITVEECGVYVRATVTPYYFMTIRDIITGGIAVPNLSTLNVTYEIAIEL